jgi:uncharacterized protein
MNTLPLSARIENARMLWLSRRRRCAFTFASLATAYTLQRMMTMNPKLPHEETGPKFSYQCSVEDWSLISQIVSRGIEMGASVGVPVDRTIASMDIATLHCNGTPLKLWQFLASDTADFAHDFTAIGRFIDRKAGVLTGGVKLRFAENKN